MKYTLYFIEASKLSGKYERKANSEMRKLKHEASNQLQV